MCFAPNVALWITTDSAVPSAVVPVEADRYMRGHRASCSLEPAQGRRNCVISLVPRTLEEVQPVPESHSKCLLDPLPPRRSQFNARHLPRHHEWSRGARPPHALLSLLVSASPRRGNVELRKRGSLHNASQL